MISNVFSKLSEDTFWLTKNKLPESFNFLLKVVLFCFSPLLYVFYFRSSLPILKGKSKTEEMDPKKQKKFEKEEKDFRKKFKVCPSIMPFSVFINPVLLLLPGSP